MGMRLCNSPIETIMRFVGTPSQNGPKMAQLNLMAKLYWYFKITSKL